jgi:glycine/D-amino acid oxidase-like deaminating enzyme
MGQRVLIIGAGITGASIAYHLARHGAEVTVLDGGAVAGGVTRRAFGWLNVAHTDPLPYQALRQAALAEWRRVEGDLNGRIAVDWCGALTWRRDPAETLALARRRADAGYPVRLLDRDAITAVEPGLAHPPEMALHAPEEGAVDPASATRALMDAARAAGARVLTGARVEALTISGDRVTGARAGAEDHRADTVVMAAGTGSPALCATAGLDLPVRGSPATLLRYRTRSRLTRGIVCGPTFEVRHAGDGALWSAADAADDGPAAEDGRVLSAVRAGLRGADRLDLIDAVVGHRPMPADGAPVVGFARTPAGLYLAVLHAAIVMAPSIGRLAATEILDGADAPALEPCRPSRFSI